MAVIPRDEGKTAIKYIEIILAINPFTLCTSRRNATE